MSRSVLALMTMAIVLAVAGCSTGGDDSAANKSSSDEISKLSFDPSLIPAAQELANVPLPTLPNGTECGPAEVEPGDEGDQHITYVGFECDDAMTVENGSQESPAAMFEKIGALEFESDSASQAVFGPALIRQEGRASTDVKPATAVPSGTICVESTDGDDPPYQRCAFRVGRFIFSALGNEGQSRGAEAGVRVLEGWLANAG